MPQKPKRPHDGSRARVLLIGGSSHSGKSTLASALAHTLGWKCISTDGLARTDTSTADRGSIWSDSRRFWNHPGRPWRVGDRVIRPHVVEHYLTLSVNELIEDVLLHFRSMWPDIEELILSHATNPHAECLIIEGSALWPESAVAGLDTEGVRALWLTASDDLFQTRIYASSEYDALKSDERMLVDKFLARTILYNERMLQAVSRLELAHVEVDTAKPDALIQTCMDVIGMSR